MEGIKGKGLNVSGPSKEHKVEGTKGFGAWGGGEGGGGGWKRSENVGLSADCRP